MNCEDCIRYPSCHFSPINPMNDLVPFLINTFRRITNNSYDKILRPLSELVAENCDYYLSKKVFIIVDRNDKLIVTEPFTQKTWAQIQEAVGHGDNLEETINKQNIRIFEVQQIMKLDLDEENHEPSPRKRGSGLKYINSLIKEEEEETT